jgi:hypothetical protein
MSFEPKDFFFAGGICVCIIWLCVITFTPKTAAFYGGPVLRSVPQAVNLGASHMSRRSDGVYEYEKPLSFLGGPEPPVFYDIGDISAARAAIGGNMGSADRRGVNEASSSSGFADLDDMLVRSSR